MGQKLVIGPVDKGLNTSRTAFNIDNDSFPTLINAYQWRGRVKRKRGTEFLGRLQKSFVSSSLGNSPAAINWIFDFFLTVIPNIIVAGTNINLVPGSVIITDGTDTFTDQGNGFLRRQDGNTISQINYTTGAISLKRTQNNILPVTATFSYNPGLPVMGLEDLSIGINQFPGTIAFDTKYAYNISTVDPYTISDVSFYKDPLADGINLPGYAPKGTLTATTWNGQDYQQFWSVNYQGALWVTNGINIPFDPATNVGMQFAGKSTTNALTAAAWVSATSMTFTVVGNPLIVGDYVFVNEFTSATVTNAILLNQLSGYVTVAGNTFTVVFPFANIPNDVYTPGIVQYLTNRSNPALDTIRWYDGTPSVGSGLGWVNFMPPLSRGVYSIADTPQRQYYLVGARGIVAFKDRLLFMGPVIQASTGNPIYLQDTIIYSQDGTPYYTATFAADPSLASTTFNPILVPLNQTATVNAWWEDQTGFGGFIQAGVDQPMTTWSPNQDSLIVGFDRIQTRVVYTGDDIQPFNFFLINSELGSGSTFSVINMDKGVMTRGNRGFVMTNQVECRRIDVDIPDLVFEQSLLNHGTERITAARDFISEWVYFTYPKEADPNDEDTYIFPNQTLQFNYRDNSWAIFNETYTTYGTFRPSTGFTWASVGRKYNTWRDWNDPWNAGQSNLLQPQIIGGNQQGFILIRSDGTNEGTSLFIQDLTAGVITSANHTLNEGDYILLSGVAGLIGPSVNGKIYSVASPTTNTFTLNPTPPAGLFLGGGYITRMYQPYIQTKQFPMAWNMGRKTRIGPQQYLFTTTPQGQIQLLIFLSQTSASNTFDPQAAFNNSNIVPSLSVDNNALIYSTVLYTCTESTNLGLTASNSSLMMINDPISGTTQQIQTWHRMNTSLIGDTVQIGFTLSDTQMRDINFSNQFVEIEFHGAILDLNPSQMLI
jgi:signal peptidase I